MSATIDLTQSGVLVTLRAFILAMVGGEVIEGLGNGVAMPAGPFVAMTPIGLDRLATNVTTWTDTTLQTCQHQQFDVQVDIYGPGAGDQAAILATLMRDPIGAASGILYCEDPRQMVLTNAEAQYEQRWMILAHMQYNPTVTTPVQTMTTATVGLIPVF